MGIEPTGRKVNLRPNGFEDRGHHQVYKHFRVNGRFKFNRHARARKAAARRRRHAKPRRLRNPRKLSELGCEKTQLTEFGRRRILPPLLVEFSSHCPA